MKHAKKAGDLVAIALREYANRIMDKRDLHTVEEAQNLDRALRSCPGISDIDVVWVRWSYEGSKRGWLTDHELRTSKGRRYYPDT